MKRLLVFSLALSFFAASPAVATGGHGETQKINVMSQNQYLGADLNPIIAAETPEDLNEALVTALEQIAANNFPERSKKLAWSIARRHPELVGLQEVFRFECFNIVSGGPDCSYPSVTDAFNDHLTLTWFNLLTLGEPYQVAAVVENLNIPGIPVDLDFDESPDIVVSVLDRDVILARSDVPVEPVPFSSICGQAPLPGRPAEDGGLGCNYATVAVVDTLVGEVAIERGFVGVDAAVDGRSYRFVNTHLEVQNLIPEPEGTPPDQVWGGSIQAAQATELNVLVAASLSLIPSQVPSPPGAAPNPIIVGDINSSAQDGIFFDPFFPDPDNFPNNPSIPLFPPYTQLAGGVDLLGAPAPAAYNDAWNLLAIPRPGFTCCQLEDLSNQFSRLDERIDVIFSLEEPSKVRRGRVFGSTIFEKTYPSKLWPSDHGQPAVELHFD